MITVDALVKDYNNQRVLDNLNFNIAQGEVVGFLGPNGAGKTTTMRILTGFIAPTSGDVSVNGYNIFSHPIESKKSIGYLSEQAPLYNDMRVYEYLQFRASLKGVQRRDLKTAVSEVIDKCALSDVYKKIIGQLSKGYKQRVGLADSLLAKPKILILDEPTAGLDPNQIVQFRDLISSLAPEHTILISTHIMQEVEAICNRVIIIDKGKIVAVDSNLKLKDSHGGNFIDIEVKNETDALVAALKSIDGVSAIKDISSFGIKKLRLELSSDKDIREEIFKKVLADNATLLSMNKSQTSIEDVFVKLTGNSDQPDGEMN